MLVFCGHVSDLLSFSIDVFNLSYRSYVTSSMTSFESGSLISWTVISRVDGSVSSGLCLGANIHRGSLLTL